MSVSALDLCARRTCAGCARPGTWLCPRCSAALPPPAQHAPIEGVPAIHCPWAYEGAARELILALKLRGRRDAAEPLVAGVVDAIQAAGSLAATVTWVPARRRDVWARGFDHAGVLAAGVARALGLAARPLLVRRAARPDQARLSAPERRANLLGAFGARSCSGTVLVVDDLITTGSTARVCAGSLLSAGAERIEVAVACRA